LWTGTNSFALFYPEDGGCTILRIVSSYLSAGTQCKIRRDRSFLLQFSVSNSHLISAVHEWYQKTSRRKKKSQIFLK